MKTIITILTAIILISSPDLLIAQDWKKINPDGTQVKVDTTLVRAVVVTIAPQETIGPLTHPAHCAYILTDGKIRVYPEGGDSQIMDLKQGMTFYFDPQPLHKTENIGDKPFSFLVVELKEHPYSGLDPKEN